MREVLGARLWIGSARDARNIPAVLDLGITAVVDLAMEEPPMAYPRDITVLRIPLMDGSANAKSTLSLAIQASACLLSEGVPTLIACSAGMSRSPIIAAAALSKFRGIALEDALAEVIADAPHDPSPALWQSVREVFSSE